jgi:hypothetical protein
MKLFMPLAVLLALQSCDQTTAPKKEPTKAAFTPRPGLHRFILTRIGIDVALDTQTGQLCRTWDWPPTAEPPKDKPFAEVKPGEYAPLCLTLYQQYPSGTGEPMTVVPEN